MSEWEAHGRLVELTGRDERQNPGKRRKRWRTAIGDSQLSACIQIAARRGAEVVCHSYFHFQWRSKSCILEIYPSTQHIFLASGTHGSIDGLPDEWDVYDAVSVIAGDTFGIAKPEAATVGPAPAVPHSEEWNRKQEERKLAKLQRYEKKRLKQKKKLGNRKHAPRRKPPLADQIPQLKNDPMKMGYYQYIQSPEWRLKRALAMYHHGEKCYVCGTNRQLQVHHLHYRTLGAEAMKDLRVLCNNCHVSVHEAEGNLPQDAISKEFRKIVG